MDAPSRDRSGRETRDALADVLRDQAERRERRSSAELRRRRLRAGAPAVVALTAVSAWLWIAPPAAIAPEPTPPPPPRVIEAGLRMDMWMVASSVERAREGTGRLPTTLDEVLEEPEDARGIRYVPAGSSYTLVGERDGVTVRWSSTQGLPALTAPVPEQPGEGRP